MLILSNILSSILVWVPSGGELVLIGLLILIFFGAKRIPELARGLGKGIREFKDATKEVRDEIDENVKETKKSIKD
ncbi:Sec-independent protein translocase subunit TatA/TatB [Peijinzhouia sedimentorum]|jgi:sec-independent protein translocase protein TatA